jgi:hypothetical protein
LVFVPVIGRLKIFLEDVKMTKYRKFHPFFLLLVLAILMAGLTESPDAVLADEIVTQDVVCIPAAYAQARNAQATSPTEVANPRIERLVHLKMMPGPLSKNGQSYKQTQPGQKSL